MKIANCNVLNELQKKFWSLSLKMEVRVACSKWYHQKDLRQPEHKIGWFCSCHHLWRFEKLLIPANFPKAFIFPTCLDTYYSTRKENSRIHKMESQVGKDLSQQWHCLLSIWTWVQIPSTQEKTGHGSTGS